MPNISESNTIEDGMVMGFIQVDSMADPIMYAICTVEEWEAMTAEEAEKEAIQAKNECGLINFWY